MYIYIISRSSPPNEFGVEIGFSPVIEWGKGKQEWKKERKTERKTDRLLGIFTSKRLWHLECDSISISNLNLTGLFSTERGNSAVENEIIDWELRLKTFHFVMQ